MPFAVQSVCSSPAPVEAALQRRRGRGLVFLDSSEARGSARSYLASDPVEVITGSLWEDADRLRKVMQERAVPPGGDGMPAGGLFGWIGFDGNFVFGVYPTCHVYGHRERRWWNAPVDEACEKPSISSAELVFRPQMSREAFIRRAAAAKDYIAAGDIYQVNLSYPWFADWSAGLEPFGFYQRLRSVSPAPYAAFVDLAGTQVFSASPECFLRMSGRTITTRPIKGTRPRGHTKEADRALAKELRHSPKERAELVMITDLERNDLGRVCEFGSVRVSGLLEHETFAQVHHLVSTVEGTLRPEVDHLDALIACFPGGSISGAPKKRALEIIAELEPHPRGLYTGAIGFLGFGGESHFSIAIRTAWLHGGVIRFHTGAGIVADSVAEMEHEETLHKAVGLLRAAGA